jgi:hypothetical protein
MTNPWSSRGTKRSILGGVQAWMASCFAMTRCGWSGLRGLAMTRCGWRGFQLLAMTNPWSSREAKQSMLGGVQAWMASCLALMRCGWSGLRCLAMMRCGWPGFQLLAMTNPWSSQGTKRSMLGGVQGWMASCLAMTRGGGPRPAAFQVLCLGGNFYESLER